MRRSLLHFLRLASLLLCIASLVLWHRSYRVANGCFWQNADSSLTELISYTGGVQLRQIRPQFLLTPVTPARHNIAEPIPANANWQTRAGSFTNQVLWQRAGFVLLAGHSQVLTLTSGSGFGYSGISGTITTTTLITNGSLTVNPITTSGLITVPPNARVNTSGMAAGSSLVLQTDSTQLLLIIPWWFIAALAALLPTAALLRAPIAIRTRRRLKLGLCIQCGYDLRSSSGRCPECGQAAA